MQRLMADIERLSTRRVQNAVDCSEAMKWRRTVAGGAPFAAGTPHTRASRASSPEINGTSSDATADGRYRKTTHETRSERRRSLGGDEMATLGGRARPLRHEGPPPRESQSRELTGDIATSSDAAADGSYRKMVHETRSERRRSLRTDEMATHGDRTRTPSDRWAWRGGGSNGSKSAQISHFQSQPGSLKVVAVSLAYVLIVKRLRSGWRRRLGPPRASKVRPGGPSWGPVESAFGTISWVQKLFDRGFLFDVPTTT